MKEWSGRFPKECQFIYVARQQTVQMQNVFLDFVEIALYNLTRVSMLEERGQEGLRV